jgi:hypothetical protein
MHRLYLKNTIKKYEFILFLVLCFIFFRNDYFSLIELNNTSVHYLHLFSLFALPWVLYSFHKIKIYNIPIYFLFIYVFFISLFFNSENSDLIRILICFYTYLFCFTILTRMKYEAVERVFKFFFFLFLFLFVCKLCFYIPDILNLKNKIISRIPDLFSFIGNGKNLNNELLFMSLFLCFFVPLKNTNYQRGKVYFYFFFTLLFFLSNILEIRSVFISLLFILGIYFAIKTNINLKFLSFFILASIFSITFFSAANSSLLYEVSTGRSELWGLSLKNINLTNFILGNGFSYEENLINAQNYSHSWLHVPHIHNSFLSSLLMGGISILCIYIYLFYKLTNLLKTRYFSIALFVYSGMVCSFFSGEFTLINPIFSLNLALISYLFYLRKDFIRPYQIN